MDIKRVNDLLDLGFSIDDIKALNKPTEDAVASEQAPASEQAQEQAQEEQAPASEQAPANTGASNELDVSKVFDDAFKQLNDKVEEFNKKMQSLNSTFADMGNADDGKRTDADIIASIIKPR